MLGPLVGLGPLIELGLHGLEHPLLGFHQAKFFKVCCSDFDPSALDGFPLYWVKEVKPMKPKSLDELPSNDREACQILTSAGGFDTATLISLEYNAEALEKYISMRATPITLPLLHFLVLTYCTTYLLSLYNV